MMVEKAVSPSAMTSLNPPTASPAQQPSVEPSIEQVFKRIRPWGIFFGTDRFSVPVTAEEIRKRLRLNLVFFAPNYAVMSSLLLVYCAYLSFLVD